MIHGCDCMTKKIILHFSDEKSAKEFKENWEMFSDNTKFASIKQKGGICILTYNCEPKKKSSLAPNSIFRGCQHC